ncbi:GNAT family N-acetyltransferase [Leucobacter sp. UCMA 4100]|uniref:GNAT family N-acetyltransferase n=1 Tax=Leucobacter sp. UCMA 4100 TaxID=2810534 RepID=UPI0022EB1F6F|nr:GNAT family protein [Leucobacter sp. UCMA 4100]MDA3147524.1 GNAT family N-acetyltransferase [Leucobacter sp. UCMA 4100]
MTFSHRLSDSASLELMTPECTPDIYDLTRTNHSRLREWAAWAQDDPTFEWATAYVHGRVEAYFQGNAVPCVVYESGKAVGCIELRIDQDRAIGDIGYWLDAAAEGRGLVTRACRAMIEHGKSLDLQRFELRIATENERSSAVAERLGFELEGVLKQTTPVQGRRLDTGLYALLVGDETSEPVAQVEAAPAA